MAARPATSARSSWRTRWPTACRQQAQIEARGVAARLADDYPETNAGWTVSTPTVPENLRQGTSLVTILFYSAITFVLLIACVNIANLLLARAIAREREMALRSSLGASRWRIVTQLLVESLVLALSGGALGLLAGAGGIKVLRNWLAPDPAVGFHRRPDDDESVDRPARRRHLGAGGHHLRPGAGHPAQPLQSGGGAQGRRTRRRESWTSLATLALVMGEVALALALLLTRGR